MIEAKKAGTTLTGVEPQTRKYQVSSPDWLPSFTVDGALPFGYESTGSETRFTCGLDPVPASRRVFSFHRPETLGRWVDSYSQRQQLGTFVDYPTLRYGVQHLPQLEPDAPGLWQAQAEAIRGLEKSLRENRPRALVQMATGSGKKPGTNLPRPPEQPPTRHTSKAAPRVLRERHKRIPAGLQPSRPHAGIGLLRLARNPSKRFPRLSGRALTYAGTEVRHRGLAGRRRSRCRVLGFVRAAREHPFATRYNRP